jgi:peptidoglycan hydrolase-like protein with peptidoglycan-binding domain
MTVKQKQALLLFLGYYVGNVDGDWGQLSKTACKSFQKDHNLTADGVFGATTEKAVLAAVAKNETKPPTATATGDFWDEIVYFDRSEFACHCGGKYCKGFPVEPKEKLIRVADRVRKHFGAAATVSSGVRCSQHNANVGGVSNSRHLSGKAMDFDIAGKTAAQVLAYVQKQPEIRYAYAINNDYVHMDIE